MQGFEYKVVAAPRRAARLKGVRSAEERFARAIEAEMNRMAVEGWDYVRSDTLPCDERKGWFGGAVTVQPVRSSCSAGPWPRPTRAWPGHSPSRCRPGAPAAAGAAGRARRRAGGWPRGRTSRGRSSCRDRSPRRGSRRCRRPRGLVAVARGQPQAGALAGPAGAAHGPADAALRRPPRTGHRPGPPAGPRTGHGAGAGRGPRLAFRNREAPPPAAVPSAEDDEVSIPSPRPPPPRDDEDAVGLDPAPRRRPKV